MVIIYRVVVVVPEENAAQAESVRNYMSNLESDLLRNTNATECGVVNEDEQKGVYC